MANDNFDLPRPTDAVPSATSAVINDDAKVLDYVINSTGTVTTRTGKQIMTIDQAIQGAAPVPLNGGVWASGQIFEFYNQYMYYDGLAYAALPATTLPYTVGAAPDLGFVYQVKLNSLQSLSGLTDPSDLDLVHARSFKTVADLKAGIDAGGSAIDMSLLVGSRVFWRGYHVESDGGSNWGIVKSGAHVDDGGSIFSIDANTYVEANLKGKRIHVAKFGAFGSSTVSEVDVLLPLQNAVNYWITRLNIVPNTFFPSNTFWGNAPTLTFDVQWYKISDTLFIPSTYGNIDFGGSLISPTASFNLANVGVDITAWTMEFWGMNFGGFKRALSLHNNNLDIGKIRINGLQFVSCEIGLEIDCRSTITSIVNWRSDSTKKVCRILGGDKVIFRDGWLSASKLLAAGDGMFEIDATANRAGLEIIDMLYVPNTQNVSNTSIVRMDGVSRVVMDKCLMGGEAGQIPLVANYADAVDGADRGCHITIDNCVGFTTNSGSAGGARSAVELHAIPNSVVFNDYYGQVEQTNAVGLISYIDDVKTYEQAVIDVGNARVEFHVNGRTPENFSGLNNPSKQTFAKFDRSKLETTREYAEQVTNTVGFEILQKADAGKNIAYKLYLWNSSNGGSDRYSEYILASNSTPQPNGTWTIAPIIEGASTVAGRATINVSGNVEILGNSTAPADIQVVLERLSNTTRI